MKMISKQNLSQPFSSSSGEHLPQTKDEMISLLKSNRIADIVQWAGEGRINREIAIQAMNEEEIKQAKSLWTKIKLIIE